MIYSVINITIMGDLSWSIHAQCCLEVMIWKTIEQIGHASNAMFSVASFWLEYVTNEISIIILHGNFRMFQGYSQPIEQQHSVCWNWGDMKLSTSQAWMNLFRLNAGHLCRPCMTCMEPVQIVWIYNKLLPSWHYVHDLNTNNKIHGERYWNYSSQEWNTFIIITLRMQSKQRAPYIYNAMRRK